MSPQRPSAARGVASAAELPVLRCRLGAAKRLFGSAGVAAVEREAQIVRRGDALDIRRDLDLLDRFARLRGEQHADPLAVLAVDDLGAGDLRARSTAAAASAVAAYRSAARSAPRCAAPPGSASRPD